MPRNAMSCPYDCEKPAAALEMATIDRPVTKTVRSPHRSTMAPDSGEVTKRTRAKTEMTALAWSAVTSKARAKTGRAGARMPNPRATQKATAERTATSGGRPRSRGVLPSAPFTRAEPITS